MHELLMRAKTSIPVTAPRNMLLHRQRLFNRLTSGLDKRLLTVTGAAGMGKTTLVTSWLQSLKREILWVHLDDTISGLNELLELILYSIQSKLPGAGEQLFHLLSQHQKTAGMESIFGHLVAELLNELGSFVFVIDDFHYLFASSDSEQNAIECFMETLVPAIPQSGCLLLISRYELSFERLYDWQMRNWVTTISEQELRFTREDITHLLLISGVSDPNGEISEYLKEISEGWVALVAIVNQELQQQNGMEHYLQLVRNHPARDVLFQFLLHEVIFKLPIEHRTLLYHASLLEELDPKELDELWSRYDSAEILEGMVNRNMFVYKITAHPLIYRFHNLLRQTAYQSLSRNCGEQELHVLHEQTGLYLIAKHKIAEGLSHLITAKAYEAATAVIIREMKQPYQHVRFDSLCSLIEELPVELTEKEPYLMQGLAFASFQNQNMDQAIRLIEQAIQGFTHQDDESALIAAYHDKITYLIWKGDMLILRSTLDEVMKLGFSEQYDHVLDMKAQYIHYFSKSRRVEGLYECFGELLNRAKQSKEAIKIARIELEIATLRETYSAEYSKALEEYTNIFPVFTRYGWIYYQCNCLLSKARCERELQQLQEAITTNLSGLELSSRLGITIYRIAFEASLLTLYATIGELKQALNYYEKLKPILQENPPGMIKSAIFSSFVHYFMARSDEQQALYYAQSWLQTQVQSGLLFNELAPRLAIGRVLVTFDNWKEGKIVLEKLIDDATQLESTSIKIKALLLLAHEHLINPQPHTQQSLRELLALARKHQLDTFLITHPTIVPLLCVAIAEQIETDYAGHLLLRISNPDALFDLLKEKNERIRCAAIIGLERINELNRYKDALDSLSMHAQGKTKKLVQQVMDRMSNDQKAGLKITCFGKFQVCLQGETTPLGERKWRLKRSKSIFKYLLLHNRTPIHKEQLIDVFWPENTLESGIHKLHTAISNLRKVLEPNLTTTRSSTYIQCFDNHYLLTLPPNSEIDYYTFQQLLKTTQTYMARKDALAAYEAFRNLTHISHSPLLEEDRYDDWIASLRNSVELQIAQLGVGIATLLFSAKLSDQALQLAFTILDRDPYSEEAVTIILRILSSTGQISLARKNYELFRMRLRKDLHSEPSRYLQKFMTDLSELTV